ncbi:VIT1/CCC1 transporter family protein [Candidatus Woesearchaeota archaeon]|nr:VIT1/CCC1 transporter family protein [Candidatus Woesearchaeota archaeon]
MKKEINHKSNKINFKNFILGGQDGIVNVLGLVLGVASATSDVKLVIIAGLVSLVAESISMGAVAYTSSKAAKDYYLSRLKEEAKEIKSEPSLEKKQIEKIYYNKGFRGNLLNNIVNKITSNKKEWLNTIMQDEHNLSPEEYEKPMKIAGIVGLATVIGSIIPILPFLLLNIKNGIIVSLIFSALILFLVGALKAKLSIGNWKSSGLQLMLIGILSAILGYLVGFGLKVLFNLDGIIV